MGRNSLRKKQIRTFKNNDKDGDKEETADDVSENDDDDSISNMNAASETKKYVRKRSRWTDFLQHLPRATQSSELADHRHRDLGKQRRPE